MDSLFITAGELQDAPGTAFSGYQDTAGSSGEYPADPYAPAESFLLRIGEDVEWSDVVGAVLERDESTRGASNPKSAAAATRKISAAARAPKAVASVVIGGLPNKAAHEHGRRRACTLIGREKVSAARVDVVEEEEPASPKVSCLGGVRPRRGLEPVDAEAGRRGWRACFLAAVVRCC
ncbi:uncharacterized protein LOC104584271 [Brachypodium distachyon]|uniref:Uncharacterized protein n=1 Tax=Brachypodium distachyon TaxID=15368 RepID=A0A0Q3FJC6_BRADI|nr:uncharacterized protein LOC104584271 [Brachypodium distachyon]KQJ99735.1 hypothetical protein BRADI_3g44945v3 [Brachypodium distachyon]|eukprot:XP_010236802.1 uncharacterized protein LOC104584271 [Brachypodium distachyon]